MAKAWIWVLERKVKDVWVIWFTAYTRREARAIRDSIEKGYIFRIKKYVREEST